MCTTLLARCHCHGDHLTLLRATLWILCTLWPLANAGAVRAADSSVYCGLYSVYGASVVLGHPIEFKKLLDAKYIGSPHGSSASELVNALNDFDFTASVFSGLGVETLRSGKCPMILHVAGGEQLEAYNHWILYLGCDEEKGCVVDSVDGEQWLPLSQILARWDGNAIFVGSQPVGAASVQLPELLLYAEYAAIVLALIFVAARLQRRYWPRTNRAATQFFLLQASAREFAAILALGVIAGLLFHTVDSAGFFTNAGATSFVAATQIESFIPKRSLAEMQSLAQTNTVVFIDSRFAPDYEAGHIPAARSLPIDATQVQRTEALSGLSSDQNIVVYCQSSGCLFADVIATSLTREGFKQVSTFPGGWREWKSSAVATQAQAVNEAAN